MRSEDETATDGEEDEWRSCPKCSAEASICGCEDATATAGERPWLLRLICCGRDAGIWPCATWDEADEIRRSYVEAEGHDRSAIITTRLGYLRGGGH